MPHAHVNGVDLYYERSGPPDAPLVALSNSIGATLEMWEPQWEALSRTHGVLRYDTRGHGRSGVLDRPATVDDLADDLVGLLDALRVDRAHIAGLSLGGMTAQSLAARHPQRVISLTLMATACHITPASRWEGLERLAREQGMAALVDGAMERWFTADFARRRPDLVAAVRARFLAMDPRGYAVCCGVIRGMDLRPSLARITAPTMIIAGAEDTATTLAHAEQLREGIHDAELVVLPRVAHMLTLARPASVNAYLASFLSRFPEEGGNDDDHQERLRAGNGVSGAPG